jgi:hypothetical protein
MEERERLVRHICEHVRIYAPPQRVDEYFKLRTRLQKTSLDVLRQIVEDDVANVTAAQFLRTAVVR